MAENGNKEVKYEITGDSTSYVAAMVKAAESTSSATDVMKGKLSTVGKAFEEVQGKLVMLAGIVAGGAFFKEAIAESNKLTGETMNLAKRLAITSEEASALNTALGDIGSDSDTYIGAFDKFAKQIKSNEAGLQAMGLQTRDANGHLRDSNELFTEALQMVGQYKAGLDQTTAAQTLFGKGVDDALKLQRLNNKLLEEAKEKNEALGLVVTQEGVQASKAYKAAMNDVGDVLLAVKNAIGQAVMPVFTEMGEYFARSGPYVVDVFKGALTGLMIVFRTLQATVKTVMGVIFETINAASDQFGNLGELLSKLFSGDFKGAAAVVDKIGDRWKQGWSNVWQNTRDAFSDGSDALANDMQRIWGKGTDVAAPKGGSKTMGNMGPEKSSGSKWEAELAERKLAFQEEQNAQGTFQEFSKQMEVQFWQEKLALTTQGSQDNLSVRRKVAELQLQIGKDAFDHELASLQTQASAWKNNTDAKLAILDKEADLVRQRYGAESKEYEAIQKQIVETKRQAAEQLIQIEQITQQRIRDAKLAELNLQQQSLQLQASLGQISQGELLQRERDLEAQRYQIQSQALQDRLALMQRDPDRSPVALAQVQAEVEQLEAAHNARMGQLQNQMTLEAAQRRTGFVDAIESGFHTLSQSLMAHTFSWRSMMQQAWSAIGQSASKTIASIATNWVTNLLKMATAKKTLSLAAIHSDAMESAAGAYKAIVGIPYVGPVLAPAAAAAAYAGTMAFASAEGGYDIPKGVNPVTQLHQNEMVLPSKHADVIRQLSDIHLGQQQQGGGEMAPPVFRGTQLPGGFWVAHQDDFVRFFNDLQRRRYI